MTRTDNVSLLMLGLMNRSLLLFVLIPLGLVLFGGFWTGIVLLLSRIGGWNRLGLSFPASREPAGKRFKSQSARIGFVSYNNCLTIDLSKEGIYLSVPAIFRVGHRPVLIPWKEIHDVRTERILWAEYASFQVGWPAITTVRLSRRLFDDAQSFLS